MLITNRSQGDPPLMFRRILLVACTTLFLFATPAAAQSYGDILGEGDGRNPTVNVGGAGSGSGARNGLRGDGANGRGSGDLARTGSDNLIPLIQAGVVLVAGGSLLALVARRRRAERRLLTA